MSGLALLTVVGVVVWVVLVVLAQLLTPDQSALSMGLSGLATGRHGWLMKLAYVVRGATATALVVVVAVAVDVDLALLVGLVLVVVWALCSILLVPFDTDMPGDEPTSHGATHALLAAVGYVAIVVGMLLVSWALRGADATAGPARWAGPIALLAAVALFAQFAAFGAAARAAARSSDHAPAAGLARYAGLLQRIFLGLVMLWTVVVAVGV
ncbi:MAG TPA: DUF998 domain-containing protein [Thermoleophilia bacterium]|nr:DUF998 domain-containing protein [Thermoleophilia bacterium]